MEASKLIGTSQVPAEHWEAAHLIGLVPFTASVYDQRASYCMYIPKAHYQITALPKLPLLVNIHGSSRRAERCRDWLIDIADSHGAAVLAPLFPAGIDDPNDSHNYKFLRYKNIRYDLILLSIVDEVAQRWPGIETSKFYLAGFSGGGQFALRFSLLHPQRLAGVSIGAPGTVTSLDPSFKWPKGISNVGHHFNGLSVDIETLRSVKYVHLAVGADDVEPPGGKLLDWHMMQKAQNTYGNEAIAALRLTRIESLTRLRDELAAIGIEAQFEIVPGAGHDATQVFPRMVEFLKDSLQISRL